MRQNGPSTNLHDVMEEDFLRVCQYAYQGDHATPPFGILEEVKEEIYVTNGMPEVTSR